MIRESVSHAVEYAKIRHKAGKRDHINTKAGPLPVGNDNQNDNGTPVQPQLT